MLEVKAWSKNQSGIHVEPSAIPMRACNCVGVTPAFNIRTEPSTKVNPTAPECRLENMFQAPVWSIPKGVPTQPTPIHDADLELPAV
jgi:hypothetical protein